MLKHSMIPDQANITRAVVVDHQTRVAIQIFGLLPHPDDEDDATDELLAEIDLERDHAPGALVALAAVYGDLPVTRI